MKHFTRKIIVFVIPLVLLMSVLDFGISALLKQNTNQFQGEIKVWKDIYSGNLECDIAIYGSSRAWIHIDPQILSESLNKKVYNFGIDGHHFWLQHLRHLEYLAHNKKPEHILVSVDAYGLKKREDLYNYHQFLPFMLWNKNVYSYTKNHKGFSKLDYSIPLVRYGSKYKVFKTLISDATLNKNAEALRENGYAGVDLKWNSDLEKAKEKQDEFVTYIDEDIKNLFINFIEDCQENGIQLSLVYSPEYIEGQEYIRNRTEVMDFYRSVAKKHQIDFYDFSNHSMCFNRDYFVNASHLNKKGAELFSKHLADSLQNSKTFK